MRLLNSGHIGDNIQEVLVDMRFSEETYMRRGGGRYLVSEFKCQFKFFRDGYLDFNTFFLNIVIRACVRLLPNALRKIIYRKVLRRTN
ncbi:UDP-Gal:alpha-D-GlcNAc-diphosphoundecaprenol beta-1,3-galactosyltransferase [compost metagenome]